MSVDSKRPLLIRGKRKKREKKQRENTVMVFWFKHTTSCDETVEPWLNMTVLVTTLKQDYHTFNMASEEVNNIDVVMKRNYCYRKNWKTRTPLYGTMGIVYDFVFKTELVVLCKACHWKGEIKQLHAHLKGGLPRHNDERFFSRFVEGRVKAKSQQRESHQAN